MISRVASSSYTVVGRRQALNSFLSNRSFVSVSRAPFSSSRRRLYTTTSPSCASAKTTDATNTSTGSTASATTIPPPPPPPVQTSKLRQWWDNGNILIGFGWTLCAVLALDRYLLYSESRNVDIAMAEIEQESNDKRAEIFDVHRDDPVQFQCTVRQAYRMGGSHALMHVQVGDVIDVLHEGVGPQELYNLCRISQNGHVWSIGWYPVQYLEKVQEPSTNYSKWAFWKKRQ